jgi:serine/threonine-protein kinase
MHQFSEMIRRSGASFADGCQMVANSSSVVCSKCSEKLGEGLQRCPNCNAAVTAEVEKDDLIGRTIMQNYTITERIASGGMGVVYLAEHNDKDFDHQRLAVKFLHRRYSGDEELATRFLNEARMVSRIRHHHAVTISDLGRLEEGTLYIAMEYIEGVSLGKFVRRTGKGMPAHHVMRIAMQSCEVLSEAHQGEIIHRDIKPDNIMLVDSKGGRVSIKVLDFGIAKAINDDAGLTQTGVMFGTPEYMSPEQARGETLDAGSDIYALGLVLYFSLTGRAPFSGKNKIGVMHAQINEKPADVARAAEQPIPAEFAKLVMEMIAKRREDRPKSMHEILIRLERISAQQPPVPEDQMALDVMGRAPVKPADAKKPASRKQANPQLALDQMFDPQANTPARAPAPREKVAAGGEARRSASVASVGPEMMDDDRQASAAAPRSRSARGQTGPVRMDVAGTGATTVRGRAIPASDKVEAVTGRFVIGDEAVDVPIAPRRSEQRRGQGEIGFKHIAIGMLAVFLVAGGVFGSEMMRVKRESTLNAERRVAASAAPASIEKKEPVRVVDEVADRAKFEPQVLEALAALDKGQENKARRAMDRITLATPVALVGLDKLREQLDKARVARVAIDTALGVGDCRAANDQVLMLRDKVSKKLSESYHERLNLCRKVGAVPQAAAAPTAGIAPAAKTAAAPAAVPAKPAPVVQSAAARPTAPAARPAAPAAKPAAPAARPAAPARAAAPAPKATAPARPAAKPAETRRSAPAAAPAHRAAPPARAAAPAAAPAAKPAAKPATKPAAKPAPAAPAPGTVRPPKEL